MRCMRSPDFSRGVITSSSTIVSLPAILKGGPRVLLFTEARPVNMVAD
jgi:hypothetical protein